jgi:hypothetical protein
MSNIYGTNTALSANANGAANATYTSLGVIDFGTSPPHECFIEIVVAASASTSGNKQAVVYLRSSVDGTNFSITPSSTDAINSKWIGTLSLPDSTSRRSVAFPVSPQFGGALPQKIEVFIFNDCGVSFTTATGQYRTEIFG